jgi:glutaredoxin-related protein
MLNIKLIYYDYGKESNLQTKLFSSYLEGKKTSLLLHRKCHYNLDYSEEFIKQYSSILNLFMEYKPMKVANINSLKRYETDADSVDITQSKFFNKAVVVEKKKSEESEISIEEELKQKLLKKIEELRNKVKKLDEVKEFVTCKKGNVI